MSLVQNKKAGLDYEIITKYEAGIVLSGSEVKSIRNKHGELGGAHILIRGGEAFIVGLEIPPYQPKNITTEYEPARTRKLILTKKEIYEIERKTSEKGLTIIPISLYNKGKLLKLEIAIGRGKKKYDKRQDIKKRDTEREIGRTLKA
jgi:SsrA-binding protein